MAARESRQRKDNIGTICQTKKIGTCFGTGFLRESQEKLGLIGGIRANQLLARSFETRESPENWLTGRPWLK
jgi:hypothetical protein